MPARRPALEDVDDPLRFTFYEAYADEAAVAFHKAQPHYRAWADFKARTFPPLSRNVPSLTNRARA